MGLELDPDRQVLVTTGATEGIAATLLALVGPGDEVVAFEPYYDSYAAMTALAGARFTAVPRFTTFPGLTRLPRLARRPFRAALLLGTWTAVLTFATRAAGCGGRRCSRCPRSRSWRWASG